MKYQLYTDVVILTEIPKFGLISGDVVKIIDCLNDMYILEAFNVKGETIGVFSLPEEKIESLQQNEVFHTRKLEFV
jgi:hypothetical protein